MHYSDGAYREEEKFRRDSERPAIRKETESQRSALGRGCARKREQICHGVATGQGDGGERASSTVDIRQQSLFEVPEYVWSRDLSDVERVLAAGNFLCNLPGPLIANLPLLRVLDLRSNLFTCLPPGLHCLHDLQELRISNNKLKKLLCAGDQASRRACHGGQEQGTDGGSLSSLGALRVLNLGHNFVGSAQLNSISSMPRLEELDVTDNGIESFPTAFLANCRGLRRLAAGGNPVGRLPKFMVSNLLRCRLEELRIPGMRLMSLPREIGELAELCTLDVSGNLLATLPCTLENLGKLEHLFLDNNSFANVPEVVHHMASLKQLSIAQNTDLAQIGSRISYLDRLESLDIGGCQVRWIPSCVFEMFGLQTLTASHNQIQVLPIASCRNPSLTGRFDDNPIAMPPIGLVGSAGCAASTSWCDYFTDESLDQRCGLETMLLVGDQACCERVFSALLSSCAAKNSAGRRLVPAIVVDSCVLCVPISRTIGGRQLQLELEVNVWLAPPEQEIGPVLMSMLLRCHGILGLCVDSDDADGDGAADDDDEHMAQDRLLQCLDTLAGLQRDVSIILISERSIARDSASTAADQLQQHRIVTSATQQLEESRQEQLDIWRVISEQFHQFAGDGSETLEVDVVAQEVCMSFKPALTATAFVTGSDIDASSIVPAITVTLQESDHGPEFVPKAWGDLLDALTCQSDIVQAMPLPDVITLGTSLGLRVEHTVDVVHYLHDHWSMFSTHVLPMDLETDVVFLDLSWMLRMLQSLLSRDGGQAGRRPGRGCRHDDALQCWRSCFGVEASVAMALLAVAVHFGVVTADVVASPHHGLATCESELCSLPMQLGVAGGALAERAPDSNAWPESAPDGHDELCCLLVVPSANLVLEDLAARCSGAAQAKRCWHDGVYMQLATFWQLLLWRSGDATRISVRAPAGLCRATWLLVGWLVAAGTRLLMEDYPLGRVQWPCPHCVMAMGATAGVGDSDGTLQHGVGDVAMIDVGRAAASGLELLSCPRSGGVFHRHLLLPPDGVVTPVAEEQLDLTNLLAKAHHLALSALSGNAMRCACVSLVSALHTSNSVHGQAKCEGGIMSAAGQRHNTLVVNAGEGSTILVLENATIITDSSAGVSDQQGGLDVGGESRGCSPQAASVKKLAPSSELATGDLHRAMCTLTNGDCKEGNSLLTEDTQRSWSPGEESAMCPKNPATDALYPQQAVTEAPMLPTRLECSSASATDPIADTTEQRDQNRTLDVSNAGPADGTHLVHRTLPSTTDTTGTTDTTTRLHTIAPASMSNELLASVATLLCQEVLT